MAIQLQKPSSEIVVDEAIVKFTGLSTEVVKMPNKLILIDYKIWVLADGGYFLQQNFYTKGDGPVGLNMKEYPDITPT